MKKLFLLAVGLSLFPCLQANAVSTTALQKQINNLKEDLQVIQRKMARSSASSEGQDVAELSQMDETLRQTVGRIDMLEHKIKTLEDKINMINKDIDIRLKMIEGQPIEGGNLNKQAPAKKFDAPVADGAPASVTGDAVIKGSDLPEVNTKSAETIYQEALDSYNAKKYDDAIGRFTSLLTKHPEHKLAGNAQFWLGESYYGKQDYTKAAVAFAKGYEKYKNGNKGADNLFKLGASMQMLGKTEEACTAYTNLPKEFPKATENLKTRAEKAAKELKCK